VIIIDHIVVMAPISFIMVFDDTYRQACASCQEHDPQQNIKKVQDLPPTYNIDPVLSYVELVEVVRNIFGTVGPVVVGERDDVSYLYRYRYLLYGQGNGGNNVSTYIHTRGAR
jgi:hypothetical protein